MVMLELEDEDIVEKDKKYMFSETRAGSVVKILVSLDREQEERFKRWVRGSGKGK
jgi:hypothetical protein